MKNPFEIPNKPEALPMRPFCNKGDYTWEDWREETKKKYPIRYFLTEEIPFWWRVKIVMPIEDFTYWLRSHLLPSRRYHMLDLRQPEPKKYENDHYRYGWIDANKQILYACFNILVNYIEKEHKGKYQEYVKFQEESVEHDLLDLREIWTIYQWWKVDRSNQLKNVDRALSEWHDLLITTNNSEEMKEVPRLSVLKDRHSELEKEFNRTETEMLKRLIELREYMWT